MDTRQLIFGYLKKVLKLWLGNALTLLGIVAWVLVFFYKGINVPYWIFLSTLLLVFIYANYLLYVSDQEEVLELKDKIRELENPRPQLKLFLKDDQEYIERKILHVPQLANEPDYDELVNRESENLKNLYEQHISDLKAKILDDDLRLLDIKRQEKRSQKIKGISAVYYERLEEFSRLMRIWADKSRKSPVQYNKECAEYLKEFRKYHEDKYKCDRINKVFRKIEYSLHNIGRVPAEDIVVVIGYPDDFYIPSEDEWIDYCVYNDPPKHPDRPLPYIKSSYDLSDLIKHSLEFPVVSINDSPSQNKENELNIDTENKLINYKIKTHLLHNLVFDLEPVDFILEETSIGQMWEFEYSIHEENLREPIKGSLFLEIRSEEKA